MIGINSVENFIGGDADLVKAISKLGYNDTPFFNAVMKATPAKSAESWKGHAWRYETSPDGDDSNAHVEGSAPAAATSSDLSSSLNHFQIIKHTYGVTGSMEDKERSDGTSELTNEGARSSIAHRKTIEKAIFGTQAPVQGVKSTSTAGVMGGLQNWLTVDNTLDLAGDLSMSLIRELLKLSYLNGQTCTHLYMGDKQKDALDDLLSAKVNVNVGATTLEGTNYMTLKNMVYAQNVKVVLSPFVASDEILSVNHADLALVYQRLSKTEEIARTKDAIEKELISELTLRVNNPFTVGKLSGLSV
ncbi:MAG: hypothetical protein GQ570_15160 [Helicobacteraceae bacterium]|nr:hypothetical protein [Helicobacteraceae bacterium]